MRVGLLIAETKSERVNEQHARKKCIEILIYLGYASRGHVMLFVKCFCVRFLCKVFVSGFVKSP